MSPGRRARNDDATRAPLKGMALYELRVARERALHVKQTMSQVEDRLCPSATALW